jgi:endonuclease YncB( thermonuclease family)
LVLDYAVRLYQAWRVLLAWILTAGLVLSHPVAVDGDTVRDGGERYRVANLDAPETGRRARCPAEATAGAAAQAEAVRLISTARRVEAHPTGRRDRYGRVVAYIEIDGVDLGARLIEQGLARPWYGRSSNFCARPLSVAVR